jgi:hypothetical protein
MPKSSAAVKTPSHHTSSADYTVDRVSQHTVLLVRSISPDVVEMTKFVLARAAEKKKKTK